jgi:uncharacterized membrane protein
VKQSKKESILEAVSGVTFGIFVAYAALFVIFPIFDIDTNFFKNAGFVFGFSVASMIRTYITRRVFEYYSTRRDASRI